MSEQDSPNGEARSKLLQDYYEAQLASAAAWEEIGAGVDGKVAEAAPTFEQLQLRALGLGMEASIMLIEELRSSLSERPSEDGPRLLRISEAARRLGFSVCTMRRLADEQKIPMVRLPSGQRCFPSDAIDQFGKEPQE